MKERITVAAQKKLEPGSDYEKYDLDGDGIVTDEEFEMDQKLMRMENEDKKEDAQRYMAWFALFGMLLYPSLVVISVFMNIDKAASVLGDMAPTYFVSVAAIVAAFFGKEAYVKSKDASVSVKK
tara:strand:+ start:1259 stop:1630 length:372 start_codon:yes stop_codon:yes gene_type:complete